MSIHLSQFGADDSRNDISGIMKGKSIGDISASGQKKLKSKVSGVG